MGNGPGDLFEEAMAHMGVDTDGQREAQERLAEEEARLFEETMEGLVATPEARTDEGSETETPVTVHSPSGLKRLVRQGSLRSQATLDLHQMTRVQALRATRAFLVSARKDGHQMVTIICGRGLHSRDGAVLPDALDQWLNADLAQHVTLAMPALGDDGGQGARYVVLRK